MTKRALGPGAICCGEPDCDLCGTAPATEVAAPAAETVDPDPSDFDWEDDEL